MGTTPNQLGLTPQYRNALDQAHETGRALEKSVGLPAAVKYLRVRYESLWHEHDGLGAARALAARVRLQ